jgi:hypothetical protein
MGHDAQHRQAGLYFKDLPAPNGIGRTLTDDLSLR